MENMQKRTMDVVLAEIKENITKFNLTTDVVEKAKLEVALKNLESEYNELSLLHAWAGFKADEQPMVAFAKAYDYSIVGHKDVDHRETKDGVKTIVRTRVVDETKTRILNVQDFVEWTEESGVSAAHDKGWRKAINDVRDAVIDQWKGFMASKGDTRVVSIGKMKKALQGMVNALMFVEGKNGNNAFIVKGDVAKAVFALCTQRKDGLKGSIMSASVWKKLQMDVLHAVAADKEFTINFGEEEDEAVVEATTAEEKTENK